MNSLLVKNSLHEQFLGNTMKIKCFCLLFAALLLASCAQNIVTTTSEDDEWIMLGVLKKGWFWDIYAVTVNDPGKLVPDIGYIDDKPSWSPDNQWIVYSTRHKGLEDASKIYVVKVDGTSRTKIAKGDRPAWSPKGDQIVFTYRGELFLFSFKCITDNIACDAEPSLLTAGRNPDWSPDGNAIVYEIHESIYVIETATSKIQELYTPQDGGCAEPDWSSTDIIIFRCWGENRGFYTVDSNGENFKRVALNDIGGVYPKWSPSGTKFAFISYLSINSVSGATTAAYVVNADGSNLIRLTPSDDDKVQWLAWMPQGMKPEDCQFFCQ